MATNITLGVSSTSIMSEHCLGRQNRWDVIPAIFTCLLSHTSFLWNPLLFSVCRELCFVQVEMGAVFKLHRSAKYLKHVAFLQKEILEVLSWQVHGFFWVLKSVKAFKNQTEVLKQHEILSQICFHLNLWSGFCISLMYLISLLRISVNLFFSSLCNT